MIGCLFYLFLLIVFGMCTGWVPMIIVFTMVALGIIIEQHKQKKKVEAYLEEEKQKSLDISDKMLVKPEGVSADIKRLKYLDEDRLNMLLPRVSAMTGISLAFLWDEIRKAKAELPDKYKEKEEYWKGFYADCYGREVDDLELEDLDAEEREELLEDLYDDQEVMLDDYDDQMDDLDDDFDVDFDSDRNDVYGNPDFWDSHDDFDSHNDHEW